MSGFEYVQLFAVAVWMLMHSLAHVLPLFLALVALFAGLPLLGRLRMQRVTVRN